MKKKEDRPHGGSMYKIIHAYLLCSVCVLCAVALAAGLVGAHTNTELLSAGRSDTTLALAHREERLEININESTASIELPEIEPVKNLLSYAPPPLCNLLWFMQSIGELLG